MIGFLYDLPVYIYAYRSVATDDINVKNTILRLKVVVMLWPVNDGLAGMCRVVGTGVCRIYVGLCPVPYT